MNNDLERFFGGAAFTPSTIAPQGDFEVIPPGKYPVLIEDAEMVQTKKGTGHFLKLTMVILDGQYKNRKIWDQINIDNPSADCVEIGMREFAALGLALGLQAITDTTQLLRGVVIAHVKVKDDRNYVRTYSAPTEAQPQTGDATPQEAPHSPTKDYPAHLTQGQTQGPSPTKRPWERN